MMGKIQKMDKRLEAESVSLLRHLLDLELKRVKEENDVDIIMFIGVDGRVFSSHIPDVLNPKQFHLLTLVRGNMEHICMQLKAENLSFSIQQYEGGSVVISGVGKNAFLILLLTRVLEAGEIQEFHDKVVNASVVMKHCCSWRSSTRPAASRRTWRYSRS
jgi:predicted regulator of Ras-like GTPase activity (Roadblock/LC7/MglB family)